MAYSENKTHQPHGENMNVQHGRHEYSRSFYRYPFYQYHQGHAPPTYGPNHFVSPPCWANELNPIKQWASRSYDGNIHHLRTPLEHGPLQLHRVTHHIDQHRHCIPASNSQSLPAVVYIHTQDKSCMASDYIYDVREADILCGRGAPSQYHPGNLYFRDLVQSHQSSYLAARRIDKPAIASRICEIINERGGRFLKRVKVHGVGPSGHFCWQDIGEQRAYEKACQALREGAPDLRRKLAAKEIAAAAICLVDNIGRPTSTGEQSCYLEQRDDSHSGSLTPSRSFHANDRDEERE
jgi:hypothetical protein